MPLDVSRQVPRDRIFCPPLYMSGMYIGLLKIKKQREIKFQKLR